MNGKVKFFKDSKGIGFITTEAVEDIFVHISALEDGMSLGDNVFCVYNARKSYYH